jgi:uncharacterized protein with von Willebrand factor type A (vWA) domain
MLCYNTTHLQQVLYRGEAVDMTEGNKRGMEDFLPFVGDLFGRMYSGDRIERKEANEDLRPYELMHDAANDVPEWSGLVERTRGNHFLSVMSASAIGNELAKALPEDVRLPSVSRAEGVQSMLEEMLAGVEEGSTEAKALERELTVAQMGKMNARAEVADATVVMDGDTAAARMRVALRAAIDSAAKDVESLAGSYFALGGGAMQSDKAKQASMRQLADAMKQAPVLAKILELAGRLQRIMASVKTEEVGKDPAEIVGVTTGSDLGRLLPSEMCKLAMSPKLFFADMMEQRLMQYQSRKQVQKGRGPLVVCIDHSGSMQAGGRHVWASAIAVALMTEAMSQKRPFAMSLFNSSVQDSWAFSETGDMAGLLSLVSRTPNGGTNIASAIDWAYGQVASQPKADIVILTDGEDGSLEQGVTRINEWKRTLEMKILAVRVADDSTYYRGLEKIADQMWEVSEFADAARSLLKEVVKK